MLSVIMIQAATKVTLNLNNYTVVLEIRTLMIPIPRVDTTITWIRLSTTVRSVGIIVIGWTQVIAHKTGAEKVARRAQAPAADCEADEPYWRSFSLLGSGATMPPHGT